MDVIKSHPEAHIKAKTVKTILFVILIFREATRLLDVNQSLGCGNIGKNHEKI